MRVVMEEGGVASFSMVSSSSRLFHRKKLRKSKLIVNNEVDIPVYVKPGVFVSVP